MKNKQNKLAKLLRQMRLEANMSLRQFGEYLGISHAYLDKLEKGIDHRTGKAIAPTIEVLRVLARNLNMPARVFFKLCGYFDYDAALKLDKPHRYITVDIMDELEELRRFVAVAESVTVGGRPLTPEEREGLGLRLDGVFRGFSE